MEGTEGTKALLLVEKDGRKEEENDLIVTVKPGEIITKKSNETNYHMHTHPGVTIQDLQENDILLLTEQDFNYILPVHPCSQRLKEYTNSKRMNEIKSISTGDMVSVLLDHDHTQVMVTGLVRYIGTIPSHSGIYFGIELTYERGKGNSDGHPHFHCGFRNAAYISMDKILQKSRLPNQPLARPITNIKASSQTLLADPPKQRSATNIFSPSTWFSNSTNTDSNYTIGSPSKSKIEINASSTRSNTLNNTSFSVPHGLGLNLFVSSETRPNTTTEMTNEKEDNQMTSKEKDEELELEISESESESDKEESDNINTPTKQNDKENKKQGNNSREDLISSMNKNFKYSYKDVILYDDQNIGTGGWADVIKGKFREDDVAIKIMHKIIVSEHNLKLIYDEISILSQLRHKHLLMFYGAVFDHPSCNPMIITELMDTSLRKAYEEKELTPAQQPAILLIMRHVALGLNYLHCLPDPIIHRDVSSANVLLERLGAGKWRGKLGDFGSAKMAYYATTPGAGAMVYAPPEAYQPITSTPKPQTVKMDVYSYGILLCEILMCRFPFTPFEEMLKMVSHEHCNIIRKCTEEMAVNRPSMKDVINWIDKL